MPVAAIWAWSGLVAAIGWASTRAGGAVEDTTDSVTRLVIVSTVAAVAAAVIAPKIAKALK